MRHRVRGRKLKRTASHRAALLKNLSAALIKAKRIKTTLAKAKELRTFVEPLITKARVGDLHSHKQIMDLIKDKDTVKELMSNVIPTVGDRPGGYTRVVKLGRRLGDAAEMAMIELVDFNEVANAKAAANKEKKSAKAESKKKKNEVEDANVVEETTSK
ncbi:MAG: 50S ribosomal protein L17 [Ignavibacteria bacterium]|jgi:large subunit ribosomal protein L17|nr:50S ribosomal protein L17 [Ignavibacteria bacterium]